jgi:hypothetical protein
LSNYIKINKPKIIMKKLFILLTLCLGISASMFAQASAMSSVRGTFPGGITPGTGTKPGLSPSDSTLPCSVIGTPVSDTIYFTNYDTVKYSGLNLTLTSLTIDSLYLPNGLSWSTNKANNTFGTSENGVIYVSGTTHDSAGQYKLRVIVTAVLTGFTLPNINAETYTGLAYRVRVTCAPLASCPGIDNSQADSAKVFINYNQTCALNVGINEINSEVSNVSVVPNPFSSTAKITFNSDIEGTFTIKMVNLIGATLSSKEIAVTRGSNEFSVERNGLSSGIYLLSLSNGSSSITKKIIVE